MCLHVHTSFWVKNGLCPLRCPQSNLEFLIIITFRLDLSAYVSNLTKIGPVVAEILNISLLQFIFCCLTDTQTHTIVNAGVPWVNLIRFDGISSWARLTESIYDLNICFKPPPPKKKDFKECHYLV